MLSLRCSGNEVSIDLTEGEKNSEVISVLNIPYNQGSGSIQYIKTQRIFLLGLQYNNEIFPAEYVSV